VQAIKPGVKAQRNPMRWPGWLQLPVPPLCCAAASAPCGVRTNWTSTGFGHFL